MNAQHQLTDAMIRAAIDRRAASAAEGDLRARVLAAAAVVPQRRDWRAWLLDDVRPQRRTALRLSLALILLTLAALVAVLVGFRPVDDANPSRLGALAIVSGGDLYVAGPAGDSPRLVWDLPTTATEDTSVRLWWLDTETLLLHSWISPTDGVSVVNLVTGAHRLLDPGDVVALSPDRRVVAIPGPDLRVRLIEIATGAVAGDFAGMVRGYPATWSPDGRSLLSESPETIDRTDIATGEITILASGLCCGLSEHWPTWSPDGTRVVYVNYHLPIEHTDCDFRCGTLWSVPAAGGEPTRITPELGSEILPAFSPDGRWIAYIDQCPCRDAISAGLVTDKLTIIATDGSRARPLAPDPRLRATPNPSGYWAIPGLESVPSGQFTWDPDSAGITYVTRAATLWHVTLDGVVTQLEGSAITEFARQVLP